MIDDNVNLNGDVERDHQDDQNTEFTIVNETDRAFNENKMNDRNDWSSDEKQDLTSSACPDTTLRRKGFRDTTLRD